MKQQFYPSILYLEDGTSYKGWSFFNTFNICGEVVFNTGMTGYQEIITDPSYAGQIITFTYPELGNTGLNNNDSESDKIHIKGIIAKNICMIPNNWRRTISLEDYLKKYNIPHIFGVDTRSLTKHLRLNGVMKACISSRIFDTQILKNQIFHKNEIGGITLMKCVSVDKTYLIKSNKYQNNISFSYINTQIKQSSIFLYNIVLLDFGFKSNILTRLLAYGCNVFILPSNATYSMINFYKPNAILLSNGPGDPSDLDDAINTIQKIIAFSNIPVFGICMGHQLLSLAFGALTFKLKFGHRGLNHPSGLEQKVEITSQNHGFAVNKDSINNLVAMNQLKITHCNLNDSTIAGIRSIKQPIFSVQYHPESSPGPHDADYLFSYFMNLIRLYQFS